MLTLISSELMEKIILENTSKCVKDKEVSDWEDSAWIYEEEISLMSRIILYDDMTGVAKDR